MSYFTETPTFDCEACGKRGCAASRCARCEVEAWKTEGHCHGCGGAVLRGARQCSRCREDEDIDVAIGYDPNFPTDPLKIRQRMSHVQVFSGARRLSPGGGDL